jgi:hypothetical protein
MWSMFSICFWCTALWFSNSLLLHFIWHSAGPDAFDCWLYVEKLKPLEVAYRFNDFANPLLVNFIHSLVLLDAIGYSVLKSSHADCVLLSLFTCSCFASTIFQTSSDFDAKPMVMLLGQYSTGKTTFIKHLLKTSYPGLMLYHIQQIWDSVLLALPSILVSVSSECIKI